MTATAVFLHKEIVQEVARSWGFTSLSDFETGQAGVLAQKICPNQYSQSSLHLGIENMAKQGGHLLHCFLFVEG